VAGHIAGIVPATNPWFDWNLAAALSLRWVEAFPSWVSRCSGQSSGIPALRARAEGAGEAGGVLEVEHGGSSDAATDQSVQSGLRVILSAMICLSGPSTTRRSLVPRPVKASGSSTTLSFVLKFSVYYCGGGVAFSSFCLSRPSPAGPTRYAPLFSGFARSAMTPTEHADAPERDEAGESDQSSHLNNHVLTSVPVDLHRTSRRRKERERRPEY
jgi:hypothetical protein